MDSSKKKKEVSVAWQVVKEGAAGAALGAALGAASACLSGVALTTVKAGATVLPIVGAVGGKTVATVAVAKLAPIAAIGAVVLGGCYAYRAYQNATFLNRLMEGGRQ
jgi:hypothetical protein